MVAKCSSSAYCVCDVLPHGPICAVLSPQQGISFNWRAERSLSSRRDCSSARLLGLFGKLRTRYHNLVYSTPLPRLRPLLLHRPIIPLPSALLDPLHLLIFALEPSALLLSRKHLFHKCLLALPILDSTAVELGGSFHNDAELRVFGYFEGALLTIHALRVENGAHIEKLKVPF
jgi:hypothetical protein